MSTPMQSACRLSRRWHQQFCRSPSFAGHKKCLRTLQPVRGYRQVVRGRKPRFAVSPVDTSSSSLFASIPEPARSDVVVREYEQDDRDKRSLRRTDPTLEINTEMAAVRAQMEKLEQELAAMKKGPFGPQSEFMQSLPMDEREQLLEALAAGGALQGGEEDMLNMAELERLEDDETEDKPQKRLGVTLRIPKKDQAFVRHFNKALRAAQEAPEDIQKSLILWTWYLRCQQQIHNFSTIVSQDVWKALWETQAGLKVREKPLIMLAADMLKAGETLEPEQWLAYIQALHKSGDTATAIEIWNAQKQLLRNMPQQADAYWTLGVRLYATLGRPLKAQETALNAITNNGVQPQILVPVVAAWAKSRGEENMVKAWACYLRLREKLGKSITPDVFESISDAFLDANCGDLALGVFKDMLLVKEASIHDSPAVYRQAVGHFEGVLKNATTEEQINRIGLSALIVLPRQFQNKFFFTSWIKKLIGEKRVDSAAMVVELMYERGIEPDAKPLNGIVGAWLRDGSVSAQKKARDLAWAMISARSELVQNQAALTAGQIFRKIVPPIDAGNLRRPVFLRKKIPAATIETFSIMVLHYTRRADYAEAERLTNMMTGPCDMKPNAFIMNHWLYADLRASRVQEVWEKYQDLKRTIKPDVETFAILWDSAKVQLTRSNSAHAKDFPTARVLLAEMVSWLSALQLRRLEAYRGEEPISLYDQIVRCFCLSADLPGTLVAMHALHEWLGVVPTDNSIRLVCNQVARLLPQTQPEHQKGRASKRSFTRHKNVLTQVADIVETIESRRKLTLVEDGADARAVQDPNSEISRALRLAVMTEFMCMFMQRTQSVDDSYQNDIAVAAKSIGFDMGAVSVSVTTDDY